MTALLQAELEVAETLCQEIDAVLRYKDNGFELDEAIRRKSACCAGYAIMLTVLGRSVGLNIQGLDVPITADGPNFKDQGHLACLIHLADGRVAIADATQGLGQGAMVSKPFRFTENYVGKGSYWELKDARNPLGLHVLVRPLDNSGLVANILEFRAITFYQNGDLKIAQSIFSEAIQRNPRSACVNLAQGAIHEVSGHRDLAIADYSAAIQINPLWATAYAARGCCYFKEDQIDPGLADLDQAVRLNPKFARAYFARACVRFSQAAKDTAYITSIRKNNLAELLAGKSDTSPSKDSKVDNAALGSLFDNNVTSTSPFLDKVRPKQPTPMDSEVSRGREERCKGIIKEELEKALADCNAAIWLDPKAVGYYRTRAAVYVLGEDFEKGLADLNEAIRLDPKDAESFDGRSRVYEQKGDLDRAIADMAEVIRLKPQAPESYERRAELYAANHDIDKAAADYAQAMRLRPGENPDR